MKNELLDAINEIHEEMESLTRVGICGEHAGQTDYEDTKGIVDSVLKSSICRNLLTTFWQRSSDACPLEASEQEKQEKEFRDWVLYLDFDSLFEEVSTIKKMPDIITKKEAEKFMAEQGINIKIV